MQIARYAREKQISWSQANEASIDDFAFWLAHGSIEPYPDPMILNAINCRAIYGAQGHETDIGNFILTTQKDRDERDRQEQAKLHAEMRARATHMKAQRKKQSEKK